jgi:hypothetical protein
MTEEKTVVLHVGTMKSGTSYLQSVLRRNRRLLADHGVFVPERMVAVAADGLGHRGRNRTMEIRGEWDRFLREVAAWTGDHVIASHEFLGAAEPDQARRIVGALAPHRVEVVVTARDLRRVLPSHWQTTVKSGASISYPDFVSLVLGPAPPDQVNERTYTGFWRHQDVAKTVGVWAEAVGAARVTLVTVPVSSAPPDLLWQRFSEALGIEVEGCDDSSDSTANASLSYSQTEMLRGINLSLAGQLGPREYRATVNNWFANKVLRELPEADIDDRPLVGADAHAALARRADEVMATLASAGIRIVGDLDELRVPPFTGDPAAGQDRGPTRVTPDFAIVAMARLLIDRAQLDKAQLTGSLPDSDAGPEDDAAGEDVAADFRPAKEQRRGRTQKQTQKQKRQRKRRKAARRAGQASAESTQ